MAPAAGDLGEERRARACAEAQLVALVTGLAPAAGVALVEQLGGLRGLIRASSQELAAAGVPRRRAAAVAGAFELVHRASLQRDPGRWVVRSPADVAERLVPTMRWLEREELHVAILNTKNAVTCLLPVYAGNLAGSPVRVGEVFRDAVRRNGAGVIVIHNHPSGDPTPSAEDIRVTRDLAEAGRLLDIDLLDHIVIGDGRWVSMRSMGQLRGAA